LLPASEPAGVTASPRRGRPRSAAADEAIVTAAIEVLGEVGMVGLAMDEVAARAGVSKATIYRRWASKEEMILDAMTTAMTRFEPADTGTLRGDLTAYVEHLVDKMRTGRTRDLLPHLLAAAASEPNLQPALDQFLAIRSRPLRALLDRAVARGDLAQGADLDLGVDMMLGAITYQRLFHDAIYDLARAERLVDYILRALDAR